MTLWHPLAPSTLAPATLALLVLLLAACDAADTATDPIIATTTATPEPAHTPSPVPTATATITPTPSTITLGFVGDLMLERRVRALMLAEGGIYPFEHVLPLFEDIDLLVGNMEGTFTDIGTRMNKRYVFRTEPELATALAEAGFFAVSLSNNHATDYGLEGLERTLEVLDGAGIHSFGAGMSEAHARAPLVAASIDQPAVAFLGYSTVGETIFAAGETGGVARASVDWIEEDVRAAREDADIVIVSLHSGIEYSHEPTDTQRLLARAAIDAGAAVVVGHHPHVLQPWERYGDGVIFYSLGNFVFDLDVEDITTYGIGAFQTAVAIVTFEDNAPIDVTFRLALIDPHEHRPYPATEEQAAAIEAVLFELVSE